MPTLDDKAPAVQAAPSSDIRSLQEELACMSCSASGEKFWAAVDRP